MGSVAARVRVLVAIQLAVLFVAVGWGWLRHVAWWTHLRASSWLLAAALAGACLSLASRALFAFLRRYYRGSLDWFVEEFLMEVFGDLPLAALLALAALSGLAEEALFRGVMVTELGLVPSSLLFGLLHTGDRRLWLAGIWSCLVGYGLGSLYLATHDLAACMIVHACSNLVSFLDLRSRFRNCARTLEDPS